MASKTAIVTGAAGFIASHLVDRLISDGYTVTGIDDLSTGKLANLPSDFDLRQLDIRDPAVRNIVSEVRPDFVFHLAAQISVSFSAREPVMDAEVNVLGALNLFEGIRAVEGKTAKVVYVTSGGTADGEPTVLPADEAAPVRPRSPYVCAKPAIGPYLPAHGPS